MDQELDADYLRKEVHDAAIKGEVVGVIRKYRRRSDSIVLDTLVKLHNDGIIDLVDHFFRLNKGDHVLGHDFFIVRGIFIKAIPQIKSNISRLMKCIAHLAKEAEGDMMANQVYSPFLDFCAASNGRSDEALQIAIDQPDALAQFIPIALCAGCRLDIDRYFKRTVSLTYHSDVTVRSQAIYTLGQITYGGRSDLGMVAARRLSEVAAEEMLDNSLAFCLQGCIGVLTQLADNEYDWTLLLEGIMKKAGDKTFHIAASSLAHDASKLGANLVEILLGHIARVNPKNKGTIDILDHALSQLLETEAHAAAVDVLEKLLIKGFGELTINDFVSTRNTLFDGDAKLFSKILTRWFAKGTRELCKAVSDAVDSVHGTDIVIAISCDDLPNYEDVTLIFIARKTIGYLFQKPVTAASVILSILDVAVTDCARATLANYIRDPLLYNYSGTLFEYISTKCQEASPRVRPHIESALNDINNYLSGLKSVPYIPELQPPTLNRIAQQRRMQALVASSYEEAMKGSLANLFHKSTILYANKSLMHIRPPGKSSMIRNVMPLQSMETAVEVPRQLIYDPSGAEYMLRMFRVEQRVR